MISNYVIALSVCSPKIIKIMQIKRDISEALTKTFDMTDEMKGRRKLVERAEEWAQDS